jgi:hypothetical protein
VLVAFAAHSTHYVDVDYDADRFMALLEERARDFDDVLVCLYWRDVLRGAADRFLARGFRCTTAGHLYDRDFLVRLHGIICSAAAVVTNEIGTHVSYSAVLGRPVWLVSQSIDYSADSDDALRASLMPDMEHANITRMRALFAEPADELSAEQREFVEELTGVGEVRSPEAIRQLLADAEERWARRPLARRARPAARTLARLGRDVALAGRNRLRRAAG